MLADAISGLINGQPARTDAVVDLFGADPTPALAEFQATALSAGFVAATVMAAAGYLDREGDGDRRDPFGDLVRVSASATAAGQLMRDLLTHPIPVADPPLGGGIDGPEIPGLPGIPADLLRTAEALRKRGCAGRAASALRQWAFAVGSSMGHYLRDVITALDPNDCCPGERMTIRGHDLGDGTSRAVVFTKAGGGLVVVATSGVRSWTDTEIVVTVPAGAAKGPVGIVEFPANAAPLAEAASTAIGELGDCFGPMATARLEGTLGRMTVPPLAAPTAQADGANIYVGGAPTIRSFLCRPSGALFPGEQITLSWWVEDATDIEIVARAVPGSAAHELPPITGALPVGDRLGQRHRAGDARLGGRLRAARVQPLHRTHQADRVIPADGDAGAHGARPRRRRHAGRLPGRRARSTSTTPRGSARRRSRRRRWVR